ncbi:hypothetical protein GQX74_013110 [Glossina fuscipes]|nr:hypothetical protein GQX74_013110 [Glossina fuscipes]
MCQKLYKVRLLKKLLYGLMLNIARFTLEKTCKKEIIGKVLGSVKIKVIMMFEFFVDNLVGNNTQQNEHTDTDSSGDSDIITQKIAKKKLNSKTITKNSMWQTRKDVKRDEFWAFIGIVINMETMPISNMQEYSSTNENKVSQDAICATYNKREDRDGLMELGSKNN